MNQSSAWVSLSALISIIFFSTVATTMVVTVLPAFFLELHLGPTKIGHIEGVAASTAFFSKFCAGLLSDCYQKRKSFILLGTGLSILSKGFFALATGFVSLLWIYLGDRIAKGLRSCPSDALIADVTKSKQVGFFYDLKYVFFLAGSIVGGCLTYLLLKNLHLSHFRVVFLLATLPACLAWVIAQKYLPEEEDPDTNERSSLSPPSRSFSSDASSSFSSPFWKQCFQFEKAFWQCLFVLFVLMFARFSTSFSGIKAIKLGLLVTELPRLVVLYDVSAAVASLFAVLLSLKTTQPQLFKIALIFHALAHTFFFVAQSKGLILAGAVFSGAHLGLSQGVIMTFVSHFTQKENRGTAFSLYYLMAGMGGLLSNILAGQMNEFFHSPSYAFLMGAIFCLISLALFHPLSKKFAYSAET